MYLQEFPHNKFENSILMNLLRENSFQTMNVCVPLDLARGQGFILTLTLFTNGNHWDLNNSAFIV